MTQTERIFLALLDGPLTSRIASTTLGCVHLPRRIKDLKELGVPIHTELEKGMNRFGEPTHFNVYSVPAGTASPGSFAKPKSSTRSLYVAGVMKAARMVANATDLAAARAALRAELARLTNRTI